MLAPTEHRSSVHKRLPCPSHSTACNHFRTGVVAGAGGGGGGSGGANSGSGGGGGGGVTSTTVGKGGDGYYNLRNGPGSLGVNGGGDGGRGHQTSSKPEKGKSQNGAGGFAGRSGGGYGGGGGAGTLGHMVKASFTNNNDQGSVEKSNTYFPGGEIGTVAHTRRCRGASVQCECKAMLSLSTEREASSSGRPIAVRMDLRLTGVLTILRVRACTSLFLLAPSILPLCVRCVCVCVCVHVICRERRPNFLWLR